MTTICYKDGLIATDSLACAGNRIVDSDFIKMIETEAGNFYYAGAPADIDQFIAELVSGEKEGKYDYECTCFFVNTHNNLYQVSQDEKAIYYADPLKVDHHYSIGSGSSYALAAMDMGASAEEAVKAAIKRDTGTGGKVRVYDAKTGKEVLADESSS